MFGHKLYMYGYILIYGLGCHWNFVPENFSPWNIFSENFVPASSENFVPKSIMVNDAYKPHLQMTICCTKYSYRRNMLAFCHLSRLVDGVAKLLAIAIY